MLQQRIQQYLSAKIGADDVAVSNVARIPGGASRETWSFDARWCADGTPIEKQLILRRDPPASLLESNNDLEFELYTALAGSGIPVPPVHWLERDGGALERPFYVMERLPGATDARTLVSSPQFAEIRPEITRQKADILAKIHSFDIAHVPILDRP